MNSPAVTTAPVADNAHRSSTLQAPLPARVLVVGPLPPPNGGMALQTEALVRCLRSEGLQVEVVANNAPYQPAWIASVPGLRAGFRLLPYLLRLWRGSGRNDLVHVLGNSGWAWYLFAAPALHIAHWRGRPVLLNYRGGLAEAFFATAWPRVQKTLRITDVLAVPTEFLQEVFGARGQRAEIVPNILDNSLFKPAANPVSQLHIVVTRNLEALYDNASALQAFALVKSEIHDARLTLAGEGPERESLQQLAQALGIADAVRFAGRLPREQVAGLLQSARIVLNPSTADNSPNSLIEAMAAGVPIVSTLVGGVPQLCRPDQEALLVPARAPEQMAAALLRLHRDEDLRQRLIHAGQQRAAEFSWTSVWPRLQQCYRAAISQRSLRHA
ncbi:glycosyltransferase family 4 protein [Permianibacter sp. IMCC34836]|uniref:glycosyltransferase family 4 protein n=1 Tax=Permianibacter fluminis TaxID=2738515 RepID=UPI00155423E8|nr:glycosyltransferase family 4 protein [Permianibacter fluminis]NQD35595.1 glycosyltransferase family 4 protein [Permianibacter fluminis]